MKRLSIGGKTHFTASPLKDDKLKAFWTDYGFTQNVIFKLVVYCLMAAKKHLQNILYLVVYYPLIINTIHYSKGIIDC